MYTVSVTGFLTELFNCELNPENYSRQTDKLQAFMSQMKHTTINEGG